jgi:hypothetical protein
MTGPGLFRSLLGSYVSAIGVLVRHPQICIGPLVAAVANLILLSVVPADGGFIGFASSSLLQLLTFVITIVGLGVAVVGADLAWRGRRASIGEALDDARRRATDILIAGIGFSFLVGIAGYIGGGLGEFGSVVLTAAAFVICIYMVPAAAIGGIPGGATLQVSGERVRSSPVAAIVIALVYFAGTTFGPPLLIEALAPILFASSPVFSLGIVVSLIVALVRAIFAGYVATVLAKAYADVSYGRFRSY